MKKKITAMLLAICCISSTWTVYADDFSSGSSEVEIEITEDEDADVDDVEITEDADANDEMFSDGTESSTSGGDISAMANQIVARAEIQAQAISRDFTPVRSRSFRLVPRPAENISKMTPISAICARKSDC